VSLIAAVVDGSTKTRPRERVAAMMAGVSGRYPDGLVVHAASGCALAVGRLVTTAQQARSDRSGGSGPSVIAVVDGRFDEPETIVGELGLTAGASDGEIVVAGYLKWGVEVAAHLRGDFAFLIWDGHASRLVAARDPLGVRPLFYARDRDRFLAASDPEQLLAGGVAPIPDDHAVVEYLLWDFKDLERSFFRSIRRVPVGHALVASREAILIRDYRRLPAPPDRARRDDEIDVGFRDAFTRAVRRRLRATSPCVLHLSGGLDSSSIVCAADRLASSESGLPPLRIAGAVHPGMACDEESFIAAVEASIRLPVERWDGTASRADELQDVPLALPGGRFPLTGGTEGDIAIAARLGSRVVLSGMGGDQLGVPAGVLLDAIVEGRWRDAGRFIAGAPDATPRQMLRTVLGVMKSLAPPWARGAHDRFRARQRAPRRPVWMEERAWREWRPQPQPVLLPGALHTHVQRRHWTTLLAARHALGVDMFQLHAARNQVEIRFPFMDWDLTLYALSIPSSYWPPPWPQERLHRRPLTNILPATVVARRSKAEFSPVLCRRVKRQLDDIRAMFLSPTWASARYVSQVAARGALAAFEAVPEPPFRVTWDVWGIATLESWLRRLSRYTPPAFVEA